MSIEAQLLLEQSLAERLGRRHCVLTGRAASAIHIALRALDLRPGKIVVPAISCPSPATIPLYSGHQPVFCDISLRDFNMCPKALRRLLLEHRDVVALVPVHLYGQAAPMEEIQAIATEHNIPVIEDAAQALGASLVGRPLGSWGEVSVISFGHTKTLDVGWGGAALTDNNELAEELRKESLNLPERPFEIARLFEEWRRVYYTLIPLIERNEAFNALFLPLPKIFREMYLFALDSSEVPRIQHALQHLDEWVAIRRNRARFYRDALQHPNLLHPRLDEESAPWRYSFLAAHGLQKPITEALRNSAIDVSNWYPPLYRWYSVGRTQDPAFFRNANRLASEVINLWVAPNTPEHDLYKACEVVHNVLSKHL